jgi:hypothetical protein
MRMGTLAIVAGAVLGLAASAPAAVIVQNASFEDSTVGTAAYTPTFGGLAPVPGWTFGPSGGGASYDGLAAQVGGDTANSSFYLDMYNPPDGNQAAFIEGTGTISQSLSGFDMGVQYAVSFWSEGRNAANGSQTLIVKLDSTTLTFTGNGSVTPPAGQAFFLYTSDPFTATSASHTLSFTGLTPFSTSDVTSFIDLVSVTALPEPASLSLLALGATLLLKRRR